MNRVSGAVAALAAAILFVPAMAASPAAATSVQATDARDTLVKIRTRSGKVQELRVESARNSEEQRRGLMFRTDIPADSGMLFAPYPGDGGAPREANFWMHNTPSPLDLIFIRPNGTIARIIADAAPFSDARLSSGEPVSAVLEINGGRAAALGIAEGDKIEWKRIKSK